MLQSLSQMPGMESVFYPRTHTNNSIANGKCGLCSGFYSALFNLFLQKWVIFCIFWCFLIKICNYVMLLNVWWLHFDMDCILFLFCCLWFAFEWKFGPRAFICEKEIISPWKNFRLWLSFFLYFEVCDELHFAT